jgi:2-polyprenyl-3-methyl-5-hydroxy-6-metoxy-1,4-benzoquinol methylase
MSDSAPADPLAPLGRMDVYLIDQFMKGRFRAAPRVLDAGCGSGRNLDLFLTGGHEVWIADASAAHIKSARRHANRLGHPIPEDRTRIGAIAEVELPAAFFDVVLSIAVLHFARDREHWTAMVDAMWERLAPGGVLFARLASSIGIESLVEPTTSGRFRLPDTTERYLVSLDDLLTTTERLGGELVEPVKTVNVQHQRCMTNWIVRKRFGA